MEQGFKKAALHEIGHMLGLDDAHGFHGSSVMNQWGVKESNGTRIYQGDLVGNLPLGVTVCD